MTWIKIQADKNATRTGRKACVLGFYTNTNRDEGDPEMLDNAFSNRVGSTTPWTLEPSVRYGTWGKLLAVKAQPPLVFLSACTKAEAQDICKSTMDHET